MLEDDYFIIWKGSLFYLEQTVCKKYVLFELWFIKGEKEVQYDGLLNLLAVRYNFMVTFAQIDILILKII